MPKPLEQKNVAIHHTNVDEMNKITERLLNTGKTCFASYKMIVASFVILMIFLITSFFIAFDFMYMS